MARFEIKFLPRPRLIIRQDLPEKAVIRKRAHALTVLAVAWIGVSIFAVVAYKVGKEDADETWVMAAIWAWRIHASIVVAALLFWMFEVPSEVRYVKEEVDDEDET
jgi:hypothetical protein